jgi:hypothetical protein
MHGDAPYLDVLQDTWQKLWLAARAKGEVPDPEPNNFGKFDIAKHRTFLCANVNKQSMCAPDMVGGFVHAGDAG